jgi:hypothetical protein
LLNKLESDRYIVKIKGVKNAQISIVLSVPLESGAKITYNNPKRMHKNGKSHFL